MLFIPFATVESMINSSTAIVQKVAVLPTTVALDALPDSATPPASATPDPINTSGAYTYTDDLTGNWLGWRNVLSDHGVSFWGNGVNDGSWNLTGGKATRYFVSRTRLTLGTIVDTRKLLGWPGGQFNASIRFHFGPNGNDLQLGSIQGFTFIDDGPPATELYEFYYRQRFFDGRWSMRIGRMDANNIFDIPADAADFVNPSAPDAPLFLQPAPPIQAPALVSIFRPTAATTLMLGAFYNDRFHPTAFDAALNTLEPADQPVGTFFIVELDQAFHLLGKNPGVVGIGGFWRTGHFPTLQGGVQSGAGGGYLFVDQTLWQNAGALRRLAVFANVTGNDPRVSEIDYSLQAGALDIGTIPGRDKDKIGVGLDWVHLSAQAGTPKPYELATEGFYEFYLGHGITIQPDLQYFVNTGGGVYPDSLIGLIRVSVNF